MNIKNIFVQAWRNNPMVRHWHWRLWALLYPMPKPDANGYVIFGFGRVGSTVLCDHLHQNIKVFANFELFWMHSDMKLHKHPERWLCPNAGFASAAIQEMRRGYYRYSKRFGATPAYGFKFVDRDLVAIGWTAAQAIEFYKRKGLDHFIFMQRRNTLRQHVSALVAEARRIWTSRQTLPFRRIAVCLDEGFLSQLDCIHQYNTNFLCHIDEGRQRGERWLHLVYEDHIEQSPQVAYEKVCEFLGVEAVEVECNVKRLNTKPLSEIIENFDEVREHLSGTRYEAMLEG